MAEKPNDEQMQKVADVLLDKVFIPRFVTKLAEEGLVIRTQEELGNALEIAAKLQLLGATTQEKEAEESVAGFLKSASESLDSVPVEDAPAPEADTEKVATVLLQDPEVAEAVKGLLGK